MHQREPGGGEGAAQPLDREGDDRGAARGGDRRAPGRTSKITYDPIASSLKKSADDAFALGFLEKNPDLTTIYDLDAPEQGAEGEAAGRSRRGSDDDVSYTDYDAHRIEADGGTQMLALRRLAETLLSVQQRLEALRHRAATTRWRSQDISLDIKQGEFICVVGPSGCGKSTLLNMIAGLDQPSRGHDCRSTATRSRGAGAERVVVFQEAALYPWLNVRANVEFGLKMKGVRRSERRDIVDKYLELVNLTRFEKAFVHELSGGMKQRVQLARALAVEPRMLLMDEPFAALDAQTRDVLQLELQDIWARTGSTIFFITHNVREAALLADRVLVMTPGPGRIKAEIAVPLQRPRSPDTHAVVDFAAEIRTGAAARGLRQSGAGGELCHLSAAPSEAHRGIRAASLHGVLTPPLGRAVARRDGLPACSHRSTQR